MMGEGGGNSEREYHFYLNVITFLCLSHRNIRIWREFL